MSYIGIMKKRKINYSCCIKITDTKYIVIGGDFNNYVFHLYRDEASWACIGTRRWKMSGPEISGSAGLKGIPFTKDAPVEEYILLINTGQSDDIHQQINKEIKWKL